MGMARLSEDGRARTFADCFSERRVNRAYRLAAGVLGGSSVDAQDAVQDAAVRAWTRWADLRDLQAVDAWFDRILVNVCRDMIRAQRRLHEIRTPLERGVVPAGRVSLGVLSDSFDRLNADQRIVIALRYLEDLSLEEIALRTGMKVGTVKSRLHYALRALRAEYDASRRVGR